MLENITEITIYDVVDLKEIFLEELKKEDDINLDMQTIQKVDTVGIQLLLSVKKSLNLINKELKLVNIQKIVLDQIDANYAIDSLGIAE